MLALPLEVWAMQNVEKLSIALTPELAAMVRQAVQTGEYASTSEVIREALRLWKAEQAARAREAEELRRLWQEGVGSGSAGPLDVEEIKAEGRALLAREKQSA
jgi:antitoxin ParD1/3/4